MLFLRLSTWYGESNPIGFKQDFLKKSSYALMGQRLSRIPAFCLQQAGRLC